VGLDCHVGALRKARRDYPGAAFRLADLEDGRSLAECAPDAIVSLETAEHLEDPECFLAQARWALRPGGHLVFSAPTSLTRDYDPYHLRDWGEHRWQEALEAAGFRVLERRPMCFEAKFTDFLGTVPTTWAQKWSIFKFLLRNRHYRRERLREWLGRNRFSWCSHIWLCEPATEPVNP
jgi:SAM-dependent methyltransferase